ncbi:periplasmic/7TM domain sensor diguanylate cyclase [Candidatus Accumulibacter phosphatis]|uniref:Periplasmic/7TM domain sensor diguanylate cyclase n=1 Tax=Accumulibacter regalis TaxID=522306 RepID=C7RLE3_ACCRE
MAGHQPARRPAHRKHPYTIVEAGSPAHLPGPRLALCALWLLLTLLANFASSPVSAQVRIGPTTTEVALRPFIEVLEDPDGQLTISDVEQPEIASRFRYVAGSGDLNFGYSASAYWLRMTFAPEAGAARRWLLEIAYPSLDQLAVFADHGDVRRRQDAGDLQPFSARPFTHRNFVFPLDLLAGSEQRVHVRIASSGSLTLPVTLWSPAALHGNDQVVYTILAIYFGMLLALGLYNLLLYVSLRESIYLVYVAFAAAMVIGQSSMFGLANQFLWPDWPTWGHVALPLGYCLAAYFGALFTQMFLGTKQTTPVLHRWIHALQIGFLLTALTAIFYAYRPAGIATALLGTAFAVTAVVTAGLCAARAQPGARLFLVAWSLLLLGVAMIALRTLNWLPSNLLTLYAMPVGSALEMLLLSFALADRIHVVRREKELAQAEALRAKVAAMDALQQSERTLEQRVVRRTAELAEANERLRQSEAELRKLAHHDPLTGLANRSLLYDELRRSIARGKRGGETFAVLMIDLDGFKPVNDTYGHAVGDRLLEVIAPRLQECVRVSDVVARLGGDEFVVVVEGVLDQHQALAIGAKIIAVLSQPLHIGAHDIQVGASVGVALWPQDGDDTQHLLQSADRAMYLAKQAGRGCCLPASAADEA